MDETKRYVLGLNSHFSCPPASFFADAVRSSLRFHVVPSVRNIHHGSDDGQIRTDSETRRDAARWNLDAHARDARVRLGRYQPAAQTDSPPLCAFMCSFTLSLLLSAVTSHSFVCPYARRADVAIGTCRRLS